jgi:hypothetical protein
MDVDSLLQNNIIAGFASVLGCSSVPGAQCARRRII